MRITLELSDDLLRRAQQRADERGLTLHALVEEGLRLSLEARSEPAQPTFRLRTWGRGGLTDEARDRGLHAMLLELQERAPPRLVSGVKPPHEA